MSTPKPARLATDAPRWFKLAAQLTEGVQIGSVGIIRDRRSDAFFGPDSANLATRAELAVLHYKESLATSVDANQRGRHAVALSMARQALEALAVIEIGIGTHDGYVDLLRDWTEGRRTAGQIRKVLSSTGCWLHHGKGLWAESWADFMASLSKSLHPYAHFSPALAEWHLKRVSEALPDGNRFAAAVSFEEVVEWDRFERVALVQSLLTWTLGRTIRAYHDLDAHSEELVMSLGTELAASAWLDDSQPWEHQLVPHVFVSDQRLGLDR